MQASGDLIDRPASDVSGCRDTRPLSLLLAGGVRDCRSRSFTWCRTSTSAAGRAWVPCPDRPESVSVFVGRHLVVAPRSRAPVAVNTARGSRQSRRYRCGVDSVVSVDGSPPPSGPTQRWLAMLFCLRGDVAGQWRSGRGNAADQRGRLTGRGGTHGTSRAVPGMSASVDVAHGGGMEGRWLPPLSPPQRVGRGRNPRQTPSKPVGYPDWGLLNSHSPALRGVPRWRVPGAGS